jgi:hypothetical protein
MTKKHDLLWVFARDYPEARLAVALRSGLSSVAELDEAVRQMARSLWGANCHFGLIVTPDRTYLLRDDFSYAGPEAIRVTDVLPTAALFSRLGRTDEGAFADGQLAGLVRDWLQRLVNAYESALPDDPEVTRALFPDLVGAVAGGRVVAEVAA